MILQKSLQEGLFPPAVIFCPQQMVYKEGIWVQEAFKRNQYCA